MLRYLARQQVQGLDPGGALVYGVETVVPVHQFHRVLVDVAVTAEHLNRQGVGLRPILGGPGLDNRGEEVQQQVRLLALLLAGRRVQVVRQLGAEQAKGIGAFGIGLLGQQHAAHIRVFNDIYR